MYTEEFLETDAIFMYYTESRITYACELNGVLYELSRSLFEHKTFVPILSVDKVRYLLENGFTIETLNNEGLSLFFIHKELIEKTEKASRNLNKFLNTKKMKKLLLKEYLIQANVTHEKDGRYFYQGDYKGFHSFSFMISISEGDYSKLSNEEPTSKLLSLKSSKLTLK